MKSILFSNNANEQLTELVAKIKNSLALWVAFLTRHDLLNKDNLPKELNDQNLKKALTVLGIMNFNYDEREAYEARMKWIRAAAEALEKNKRQLMEESRAEEKIVMAKTMLANNEPIAKVVEYTKLTKEEIDKLR